MLSHARCRSAEHRTRLEMAPTAATPILRELHHVQYTPPQLPSRKSGTTPTPPKHTRRYGTLEEMAAVRKRSQAPHPSYALDKPPHDMGHRDFFLARKFDKEGKGFLSEAEQASAKMALESGCELRPHQRFVRSACARPLLSRCPAESCAPLAQVRKGPLLGLLLAQAADAVPEDAREHAAIRADHLRRHVQPLPHRVRRSPRAKGRQRQQHDADEDAPRACAG